jgi:lysophospholipase L1-like esterase
MLSYLALGDSYTIGEQVELSDNFPYQLTKSLRSKGIKITDPEIIATTGWTTDELKNGIAERNLKRTFDLVSLLIGVNNQYRGRSVESFAIEFEELLNIAIRYANGKSHRVIVVSIPDWGVTPFASTYDPIKIATEIDAYNQSCEAIAQSYSVSFVNITNITRQDGALTAYLTPDLLHYSRDEYAKWVELIEPVALEKLK